MKCFQWQTFKENSQKLPQDPLPYISLKNQKVGRYYFGWPFVQLIVRDSITVLEGYSRSWEMRSTLCHNPTRDGNGEANLTLGKMKFEIKIAIGTFSRKHPGDSWRHVSRNEEEGVKTYIGSLHSFPTPSSCCEISLWGYECSLVIPSAEKFCRHDNTLITEIITLWLSKHRVIHKVYR